MLWQVSKILVNLSQSAKDDTEHVMQFNAGPAVKRSCSARSVRVLCFPNHGRVR